MSALLPLARRAEGDSRLCWGLHGDYHSAHEVPPGHRVYSRAGFLQQVRAGPAPSSCVTSVGLLHVHRNPLIAQVKGRARLVCLLHLRNPLALEPFIHREGH